MQRPRTMKVRDLVRLLCDSGFCPGPQRGSRHVQWYHPDGRRVTVQQSCRELKGATLHDVWNQLHRRVS